MTGKSSTALTTGQVVLLLLFGLVFWFAVAVLIRVLEPMGAFGNPAALIGLFVFGALLGWPSVMVARIIGRLRPEQLFAGSVCALLPALLADALALTYVPGLYSATGAESFEAPAQILWGAGWVIIAAFHLAGRGEQ